MKSPVFTITKLDEIINSTADRASSFYAARHFASLVPRTSPSMDRESRGVRIVEIKRGASQQTVTLIMPFHPE